MNVNRIAALILAIPALLSLAADWPKFRGPEGIGISAENGLPIRWSDTENIVWKTRLPGPGASSPIVVGNRVFVTCWSGYGDGKNRSDQTKLLRHLICLDRATGNIVWKTDVPARLPELEWGGHINQHGYTTSTPCSDGERIYVYFGKSGILAYDLTGKELWRAESGKYLNSFGSGSSPVLVGNLLIVNATIESGRVLAFDKLTGKEVWRVRINGDTWSTPLPVEVPGGGVELVLSAPGTLFGFEPSSGKELWQCECAEPDYVSSTPVVRNGIIYLMGAGSAGRLFQAVRAGGKGDVTQTHIVWKQKTGASLCSPVLAGDYLCFFSNQVGCLRADTGDLLFEERLPGLAREYSSPVAADGKVYIFTRKGIGHVLAVKDKLERLATNDLRDPSGFTASPAISAGQIFIRSNEHLYCLGEKPAK